MKHEVVITSCGLVSSIGSSVAEFEKNMFAGKSGVRSIRGTLVPEQFPVPYAAWIPRETLPPSALFPNADKAKVPKSWLMTEAATIQALAGLKPEDKIDAVAFGTADGVNYELVERLITEKSSHELDPDLTRCESSLDVLRATAVRLGLNRVGDDQMISLNSACASGNQTIGIAFQGIRSGRWERVLVGGVDARCEPSNFMNFFLLGAVTTDEVEPEKASRPFAKDRSGFVRGEGAAVLVLESREAAEARGAEILAAVSGYGCTSDAFRLTDGRDDGSSVIEAMRLAVATSNLEPKDIDYINAHGTSTPLNDRLETLAIKSLFAEKAKSIPVSSIKSQIGHATIAASALEAIACVLMLQRQKISPTINYNEPDPECDLDYVPNVSRDAKLTHVLSNSFGFGGQNTCVVFSRSK